ncbi:MAG: hypothetical protein K8R40_09680 [Anaerolineaceae bacterium]|nr:hypothetical protein [Anaerolineaceae bacterium]
MKQSRTPDLLLLLLVLILASCQSEIESPTPISTVSETEISSTATSITNTPEPTLTETIHPTATETATVTPYAGPTCYTEDLPYAYAESAGVLGWKYFADRENLDYRVIYFPPTCSQSDLERDVENLFYCQDDVEQTTLILLDSYVAGRLGELYNHLFLYEFWGMGPEDYPMVLNSEEPLNPNLILLRIDRLNGEGHEGNEILGLMVGLAEHEYIHTVQAKNNLNLADMIWNDVVYRAFIERYANLNNNSGGRYYRAPYSYLSLLQMLDGLYYQGDLPGIVEEVLEEMDYTLEEYMSEEVFIFDSHIQGLVVNTGGQNYLDHLTQDELNPLMIVTRAGLGDLTSYDLVRTIYDRYVGDYNLWYYGVDDTNYLPDKFDILFEPTS